MGKPERGRLVVVVDPDPAMVAFAIALRITFPVCVCRTASDALLRLGGSIPALVVLDVSLPDLDGVSFLRCVRSRFPACPVIVVTATKEAQTLREMAALRIDGFFTKPVDPERLFAHISALVASSRETTALGRLGSHVSKVIEYVGSRPLRRLTLESAAVAVGVSPSHLAHLFKAQTGLTFKDFVLQIRVELARRLLIDTRKNLDDIAELAGFSDASHLSRAFRQYLGASPGHYRRGFRRTSRPVARLVQKWTRPVAGR